MTLDPSGRIHSIDQFRGYTVLGMFLVNFLGHYPAHYNFHHNDYFLSYSDTIMPTFLFVVGISFRFSLLRRLAKSTFLKTYAGYFRRSLALVLISVILNGVGQEFHDYQEFFSDPASGELAEAEWQQFEAGQGDFAIPPHLGDRVWQWAKLFAKSYIWETLAVIGIVQLLVLPFVHLSFWKRFGVMVAFGVMHVVITAWFNWQFFYGYTIDGQYIDPEAGLDNWMGRLWRTGSNRSWDGGIFGTLSWGFCMLAGTLCYDLMSVSEPRRRIVNLLKWGVAFLLVGYGLSCLQTLYDVPLEAESVPAAADERITNTHGKDKGGFPFHLAASPVIPSWEATQGRSFSSLLTEPPFVARPQNRLVNYWMMSKRFASVTYVTFTCGTAFVLLAMFVLITDIGGWQFGLLRTFGMNALVAYVLHKMVLNGLMFPIIPHDVAPWLYWTALVIYLAITYRLVRGLENQGIYIKM